MRASRSSDSLACGRNRHQGLVVCRMVKEPRPRITFITLPTHVLWSEPLAHIPRSQSFRLVFINEDSFGRSGVYKAIDVQATKGHLLDLDVESTGAPTPMLTQSILQDLIRFSYIDGSPVLEQLIDATFVAEDFEIRLRERHGRELI